MISEEVVTQTWQRIARSSPQDVQRYMTQMSQEQPAILTYLLTLSDDPFNRNEMGYILFIATVVWQTMKQSPQGLRPVPIEAVAQADEANFAFLERFLSAGEMEFDAAVVKMLEEYPEPEVLRYIIEALMEEDEEEPFRDEYRGLAFVCLKTVLDALIASPAPTAPGEARSGARRHRPSSWRRQGS
ncbi:MAG: hypothetical protein H5T61_06330 [Thermoflexales bacterium]|nr:hypothetical protein [Thermoflexales bacterium]